MLMSYQCPSTGSCLNHSDTNQKIENLDDDNPVEYSCLLLVRPSFWILTYFETATENLSAHQMLLICWKARCQNHMQPNVLSIYSGGKIHLPGYLPSLLEPPPSLSPECWWCIFNPTVKSHPSLFFWETFFQTLTQYQIILNFLWTLLSSGSQVYFKDILWTICSATSRCTLGRMGYITSEKWPYHTRKHLQTVPTKIINN